MKKVTVVIPNFNGMKYLKECLESLRAQEGIDFDTIVVDNGSSDGSCEWIPGKFSRGNVDYTAGKFWVLQGGK